MPGIVSPRHTRRAALALLTFLLGAAALCAVLARFDDRSGARSLPPATRHASY